MERQSLSTLALLTILSIALSGCTSVFFQPSHQRFPYLENDRLSAETVTLKSADGTKISAWRLSSVDARRGNPQIVRVKDLAPNEVRGIALQFHGNAENMTSHYQFMLWLLYEGWDVLTFDYRGYGNSEGSPSDIDGVRSDGIAAITWADKLATESKLPLVIFAQSLGAGIAVSALEDYRPTQLKLLVIDSAFYSFTSIAQEKLGSVWFTWPLQWLGWALVSNRLSAGPRFERAGSDSVFQTPAVFLHSEFDPVVSNLQGEKVFQAYPGSKVRWTTKEPGHVNTLFADMTNETPARSLTREKLKRRLREIQGEASGSIKIEKKPASK